RDVERYAGVVAFAVPGRALDDRIVPAHSGLAARLRDVVHVRAERDHWLGAGGGLPHSSPGRRDSGHAAHDREAVFLEDTGQVLGRLELLEAEFAEAE